MPAYSFGMLYHCIAVQIEPLLEHDVPVINSGHIGADGAIDVESALLDKISEQGLVVVK